MGRHFFIFFLLFLQKKEAKKSSPKSMLPRTGPAHGPPISVAALPC
jgi:hypothetical protein